MTLVSTYNNTGTITIKPLFLCIIIYHNSNACTLHFIILDRSIDDADYEPELSISGSAGIGRLRRKNNLKTVKTDNTHMVDQPGLKSECSRSLDDREHTECTGENAETKSTNPVTNPLLPGASALTDRRFLSAQSIFNLLSQPNVRERAVTAIPTGPKVNCFFVLDIGAELTDYQTFKFDNIRKRIRGKLSDGTGVWEYTSKDNRDCYTVSDTGVLKYVMNKTAPFDLRMHRVISRQSIQVKGDQFAERFFCWFFNAERAPAPGLVVVCYRGSPYVRAQQQPHKAIAPVAKLPTNKSRTPSSKTTAPSTSKRPASRQTASTISSDDKDSLSDDDDEEAFSSATTSNRWNMSIAVQCTRSV